MDATTVLLRLEQVGVVPIIRAPSPDVALRISEVLIEAQMPMIEVTFTVPRAAEVIHGLRERFPDLLVGAGTVLNASTAKAAIGEGAQFLVSAIAPPDVIAYGKEQDIAVIPGAFTPAEIMSAVTLGADVVKLFPASVGGPGYLRALHEPFPFLRILPSGGISAENVHEWLAASAVAVGVGSALLRDVARTGDYEGLRQRSLELMSAVASVRAKVG